MTELFAILIFPGIFFLFIFGFAAEFIDRKLYARFQNRIGPPWFQPFADFIKLLGKEEISPEEADITVFRLMPVISLTASITAFFYIPLWKESSLYSFNGDIIVILYLLTIPTFTYFLGGWYSRSIYSMVGAVRALTQLFAYEVPLFMSILASALLANTWSVKDMVIFYNKYPWCWLFNLPGFFIAVVSLLGKLEKVPFDIPEAETEIVAGSFTEYGGRLLAFFRMSLNIEMITGASLLAAVFIPFGLTSIPAASFLIYILKVLSIIAMLALSRTIFARLRLDQMINLFWKYFAPLAFIQVIVNLTIKEILFG